MPAAASARKSTPTRKSTPRRARSSSVASNASTAAPASPSASPRKTKKEKEAAAAVTAAAKQIKDVKSDVSRPKLPTKKNPRLKEVDEAVVKLQIIKREGHNIIIGRVKLPTVNGQDHAFLLKRFDTNAMAASSMFRLAFPFADGSAEAAEMQYLDAKYDTNRANGGYIVEEVKAPETPKKRGRPRKNPETPKKDASTDTESVSGEKQIRVLPEGSTGVRLQGTWIPAEDAIEVAEAYGIAKYADALIHATAEHSEDGGAPVLTSAPVAEVKTPRKRQRVSAAAAAASDAESSPKIVQKITRRENADGTISQVSIESTMSNGIPAALSQAEIEAQIAEAKALAAGIQKSSAGSKSPSTRGQKRRAVNDRPTAELDPLADDEDYAENGRVVRAFKRGTRVARKRPIATTASVVAAAGAVGAGALAWISGGNPDVAIQTLQTSLQSVGLQNFQNLGLQNLQNLQQFGGQIGSQLAAYLPW
ncbi:Transcription regulator HTH, APSES-type DNA-binding domain protein [Kalmanozyma brasiliensis GHG001]|uniref:Putative DNA binding component of SBF n=1 Tax=Kalmanozyma brasiliensis (strain GHG001) TaxID=1365824 RepID=V5ENV0_KALBG|nr:Transcription regulator HTH, APSES-type DNA-binding domain protein [Kalmanozyma brasiliensis GHG001]EST04598.1 Transcription regulator HTH, APSES-type DNA-binding domain protein [Kalmanozyma brasiliensis GHG001]